MNKIDEKSYKKVTSKDPSFEHVEHYFSSRISLLYGNQKEALRKISANKDRTCELLVGKNSEEYGVVVYKDKLTSEFACFSFPEAFEIKTLFVVDPHKNSGQGIATHLLNHLSKKACDLKAKCLFVSVSSKSPEALAFFLYHGFRIKTIKQNLYLKGHDEYFLFHKNPKTLFKKTLNSLTFSTSEKAIQRLKNFNLECIEFTAPQMHIIDFLKNQRFPRESFFDYFGFQPSEELIHESIYRFVDLVMKWQEESLSKRYVILFINPLYEDNQKRKLIGKLIIGISPHGDRHLLGCIPCMSLPQILWKEIFRSFKARGINKIDIFCNKHAQGAFHAGVSSYPSMKIERLSYPKYWVPKDFYPFSLFSDLSRDVQFLDGLLKNNLLLQEVYQ